MMWDDDSRPVESHRDSLGRYAWDDPNKKGSPMTQWIVIGWGVLIVAAIVAERIWH